MTHGEPLALTWVVAGVLVRGGQVLATRRSRPASLAGRWEFPGGKVDEGESFRDALARELDEELGVRVEVGDELASTSGYWPIDETHRMRAFWCRSTGDPVPGDSHDLVRWVCPDQLWRLDWLPADIAIASAIALALTE